MKAHTVKAAQRSAAGCWPRLAAVLLYALVTTNPSSGSPAAATAQWEARAVEDAAATSVVLPDDVWGPLVGSEAWPSQRGWGCFFGRDGDVAEVSPGLRRAAETECDAVTRALFGDGLSLHSPWQFLKQSWLEAGAAVPAGAAERQAYSYLARATFWGDLVLQGGSRFAVRARLTRSERALGIVACLEGSKPVPGLETLLPAALFAWPPGMDGMGLTRHYELASGWQWDIQPYDAKPQNWPLDRLASMSWPTRVRSWSDGTWWICHVFLLTPTDADTPYTSQPERFVDPGSSRGQALEDWSAELLARDVFHPVWRADVPTRCDPRDPMEPTPPLLEDVVRDRFASHPPPTQSLQLIPSGEYLGYAGVGRLPPTVGEYAGIGSMSNSIRFALRGESDSGPGEAGFLFSLAGNSQEAPAGRGLVQWVLTPHSLRITRFPLGDYPRYRQTSSLGLQRASLARILGSGLPRLLGEYGRRLTLVPVDIEKLDDSGWWRITPHPDTEVGLLQRVRVGDTPWGKCTIYADELVLHIVFDLPKGE